MQIDTKAIIFTVLVFNIQIIEEIIDIPIYVYKPFQLLGHHFITIYRQGQGK